MGGRGIKSPESQEEICKEVSQQDSGPSVNWPELICPFSGSPGCREGVFSGSGRSWLSSALCPLLSLVAAGRVKGLEAVSWEHLVKKFVTFKLEKRSLGLGVGRRDTVAILGSWMGAGERA